MRARRSASARGRPERSRSSARCGNEASRGVSYFLRLRSKSRTDGSREPIPVVGLFAQTLAARGGEFVELGAAIVLRRAPAGSQQSLPDEAKQTGIERTLFDQQCIAGDLSDTQKNAVPMQWAERNRPQDEEIESARKKLGLVSHAYS